MTHVALYRRFRPDNFDDVIGQDALINTLRGQIMNGRVNHAYLFCGPRGIGKTSVARILAKSINCQNPVNGSLCGKCSTCLALNSANNFDIIEIDAASNNGVDNIRDLRENIKFMPAAGKYRVYIIDEVHMLSISAFNALLKTLEEPPSHIVFIMATTEPAKLPITVLSRCQRFDFNRFKATDTVALLNKVAKEAGIQIENKAVETIARASEGGARDALSLLDQCSAFVEGAITQEHVSTILGSANNLMYFALAESILTQDTARALGGFNKMLDDGCNTLSVARDLMGHFRDLFIAKHVKDIGETLSVDDVTASRLATQASKASEGELIKCIDLFSTLESDLRYASHPRIFIELAIAKACRTEHENSYESLLERVEKLEEAMKSGVVKAGYEYSDTAEDAKKKAVNQKSEQAAQELPEQIFERADSDSEDAGFGEPPMEDYEEEYFPYSDTKEVKQEIKNIKKEKHETDINENQISLNEQISKLTKKDTDKEGSKKSGSKKAAVDKNAKKLWNEAINTLKSKKKMSIVTAMKKAVPNSIDGGTLIVMYDENLAGLERLEEKSNQRIINEALTTAAGEDIKMRIELHVLNEEEINFLEDINKFPKDLINKN